MEAPNRILRRSTRRSKWCITGVLAVVTAVAVAVVVAVTATLTRKKHARGLDTTVLVPLYIYPDPGSWDPLFESVTKYPSQQFLIVINPHSGPSSTTFPSIEYTAQIQNLTQYPNVRPVGYVRTEYASRNIEEVLRDVSVYSGWETTDRAGVNTTALAMHGIFFDEAPHEYSDEIAEYMSRINTAVKDASGIRSPKTVIHNPGAVPDPGFTDANTDITVVFEQSFDLYQQRAAELTTLGADRSTQAYIIHSVPASQNLRKLVDKLAPYAQNLFLTDLSSDYYQSFGDKWSDFVRSMT